MTKIKPATVKNAITLPMIPVIIAIIMIHPLINYSSRDYYTLLGQFALGFGEFVNQIFDIAVHCRRNV